MARVQVVMVDELSRSLIDDAIEQYILDLLADVGAKMRIERIRCELYGFSLKWKPWLQAFDTIFNKIIIPFHLMLVNEFFHEATSLAIKSPVMIGLW